MLTERPPGKDMAGLWEFPGGKIEDGETPEAALVRELKEELDITVAISSLAPLTFASHRYPHCHMIMPLYICCRWEGNIAPQEGQRAVWVSMGDLDRYPMPPADLPLLPFLRQAV